MFWDAGPPLHDAWLCLRFKEVTCLQLFTDLSAASLGLYEISDLPCCMTATGCRSVLTFLVWLYHSAAAPSLIDKLLLYYSTVDASHRTAAVTNQVTCLKQMIFGPACMHNKQDFSWVVTARAHDCLVTHPITPTIDVATKTN